MTHALPMGPHAVLFEDLSSSAASWAAGLRRLAIAGVIDIVPAASTVLVRCADEPSVRAVIDTCDAVTPVMAAEAGTTYTIDVTYDGDDLWSVAEACGLSVDEVIDAHAGASYHVAFCGFAPGFGYLSGLPHRLVMPRRPSPRTSVPAGSVAIAAEYSAVYPRSSPGGWHLIGSTSAVLFDPTVDPPSPLAPGTRVKFRRLS